MKIVINRQFGGFQLSREAYEFLGIDYDGYGFEYRDYDKRTDPKLVECVERLGEKASGMLANLKVVIIPDNIEFEITDYDGMEQVEEVHRIWY